MLIAAPSVTEILRVPGQERLPLTRAMVVVGFGVREAQEAARAFPLDHLKLEAARADSRRVCLKYDQLLVGTALARNAVFVTLDEKIKPAVEVDIRHPRTFVDTTQGDLVRDLLPDVE